MEREQIDWQDRDIRRKASLVGTAIRDDGTSQKVVVTNLSYHGCHLFSEESMHQGVLSKQMHQASFERFADEIRFR